METNNKSEIIISKANISDIPNVLGLQVNNLFRNVSEDERRKEGFVSFESSPELLKEIINDGGIILAKSNGLTVGYLIYFSLTQGKKIANFLKLIESVEERVYKNRKLKEQNFCILGQICIEKNWRNNGILEKLYVKLRADLLGVYDLAISDISEDNKKSVHVHLEKMNFENMGVYSHNDKNWVVVLLDLEK